VLRAQLMLLAAALPEATRSLLAAARQVSPHAALRTLRSGPAAALAALRSMSLESVRHDAERLARRPSRLTLGVAAGTVLATAAVVAGVSAGSAAPAAAVGDADAAAPAGHVSAAGQAGSAGHVSPAGKVSAAGQLGSVPAIGDSAAPRPAASADAARGHRSHAAHASARRLARPAAPARPYLIYDSVTPSSIPSHQDAVAAYSDGPHPTPSGEVSGRGSVMWISITGHDYGASVIDVEPGNASPSQAASWARHRLSAHPHAVARIYTMLNEWDATKAAVASLPAQMRARIHWWIANPTGHPHIVPGSDATQWYWGSHYDITTAVPGF
jgi:hypothetical protein